MTNLDTQESERAFRRSGIIVNDEFIKESLDLYSRDFNYQIVNRIQQIFKSNNFSGLTENLEKYTKMNNLSQEMVKTLMSAVIVIVFEYINPSSNSHNYGAVRHRTHLYTNTGIPDRQELANSIEKQLFSKAIVLSREKEYKYHLRRFFVTELEIPNELDFGRYNQEGFDTNINDALVKLLDQTTNAAAVA